MECVWYIWQGFSSRGKWGDLCGVHELPQLAAATSTTLYWCQNTQLDELFSSIVESQQNSLYEVLQPG